MDGARATPEYVPAPYLVAASSLTEEQLQRCYLDFTHSLEFIAAAPPLVFERLVANVLNTLAANAKAPGRSLFRAGTSPPAPQTDMPDLMGAVERRTFQTLFQPQQGPATAVESAPSLGTSTLGSLFQPQQGPTTAVEPAPSLGTSTLRSLSQPPQRAPTPRSPSTGSFHTSETTPHDAALGSRKHIQFSPPYPSAPAILTGLRLVRIGAGTIRAFAEALDITPAAFDISVGNHCPQTVFAGCAAWLQVAPGDHDLQHGTFSTTQDHPSVEKRRETVRRVVFARAYERPPQVVAWLSGFQFERNSNMHVAVRAQNVSATGFEIHVGSGAESTLFSADVSWAACSDDRPNMAMGTFETLEKYSRRGTGFVGFKSGTFKDGPTQVFLAINHLAADMGSDLNLRVSCAKVDNHGLSWYITIWGSALISSAGAAFIVLG